MKNLLMSFMILILVGCTSSALVTSARSPVMIRRPTDTTTVVQHVVPGLPHDEDVMKQ